MVYYTDFSLYLSACHSLYLSRPSSTRYSVKWRHGDSEVLLKVTDDVQCLLFKSNSQSDVKHVDRLTGLFMRLMCSDKPEDVSTKANEAPQQTNKKISKKKK